jgi:hypothetical protein
MVVSSQRHLTLPAFLSVGIFQHSKRNPVSICKALKTTNEEENRLSEFWELPSFRP